MEKTNTVEKFLNGLLNRLPEEDKIAISYAYGATVDQIEKLKSKYLECPDSLVQLLTRINGTYWQEYGSHTISVLILGSDVFEYPYYLKSVEQILEGEQFNCSIREIYAGNIEDFPELVDESIDPDINIDHWLGFSDCMNNGGTSRLYIDFNPLSKGTSGQIIRYLHDPDSYKVIAHNFDEYLEMLINHNFAFIHIDE